MRIRIYLSKVNVDLYYYSDVDPDLPNRNKYGSESISPNKYGTGFTYNKIYSMWTPHFRNTAQKTIFNDMFRNIRKILQCFFRLFIYLFLSKSIQRTPTDARHLQYSID
jgi:hypothetical protein